MIEPKKGDIGRRVTYRRGKDNAEFGIINSFNNHSVFVIYDTKIASQGTRREDLTWG